MFSSTKTSKDMHQRNPEWLDFLWLELTERCNLTCQHCYVSSSPDLPLHRRMTHSNWLETIHEASALGCKSLQFIGGEPMLYPRLEELITTARVEGMEFIEIYTNGTPVSEEWARKLHYYRVNVACSVYAPEARVHDMITQKPGSFDRTIAALQRLVKNSIPVRIGFIEMDANAGAFNKTQRFLSDLGIEDVQHDFTRGFGRAAQLTKSNDPFDGLCGQCWKGRLCITSAGDVYPCIMSRSFKMGNIIDDGLVGTLRSNALQSFRLDMKVRNNNRLVGGADYITNGPCAPDSGDCKPIFCKPENPTPPCTPDRPECRPGRICRPEGPCQPSTPCVPDTV